MAKTDNVKDFCKDIADSIRAKKGTSDLINPQDFSKEIMSIEGGGASGGGSTIDYYLFTNPGGEVYNFVKLIMANIQAFVVVAYFKGGDRIIEYTWGQCLIGGFTNFGENDFLPNSVKAFKLTYIAGASTLIDYLNENGLGADSLPLLGLTPCTKEEYEALITE